MKKTKVFWRGLMVLGMLVLFPLSVIGKEGDEGPFSYKADAGAVVGKDTSMGVLRYHFPFYNNYCKKESKWIVEGHFSKNSAPIHKEGMDGKEESTDIRLRLLNPILASEGGEKFIFLTPGLEVKSSFERLTDGYVVNCYNRTQKWFYFGAGAEVRILTVGPVGICINVSESWKYEFDSSERTSDMGQEDFNSRIDREKEPFKQFVTEVGIFLSYDCSR